MRKGWRDISDLFMSVAVLRRREWGCDFPPTDCLPSQTLDDEVSVWCAIIVDDLEAPLDPPELVRPWILARLVTCAMEARIQDREGTTPPPEISREFMGRMLVDYWRAWLREDWNMLILTELPL